MVPQSFRALNNGRLQHFQGSQILRLDDLFEFHISPFSTGVSIPKRYLLGVGIRLNQQIIGLAKARPNTIESCHVFACSQHTTFMQ
jgi:hypothetical protein